MDGPPAPPPPPPPPPPPLPPAPPPPSPAEGRVTAAAVTAISSCAAVTANTANTAGSDGEGASRHGDVRVVGKDPKRSAAACPTGPECAGCATATATAAAAARCRVVATTTSAAATTTAAGAAGASAADVEDRPSVGNAARVVRCGRARSSRQTSRTRSPARTVRVIGSSVALRTTSGTTTRTRRPCRTVRAAVECVATAAACAACRGPARRGACTSAALPSGRVTPTSSVPGASTSSSHRARLARLRLDNRISDRRVTRTVREDRIRTARGCTRRTAGQRAGVDRELLQLRTVSAWHVDADHAGAVCCTCCGGAGDRGSIATGGRTQPVA